VGAERIHSQTSTRVDDQLSSFTLQDLGECEEAIISPTRTVLVKGNAAPVELTERLKQLIQQSQEATNPFEKEQLDHRIARLTGGVAVLKIGAYSEPAMIEKKARAEDAVHACRGAMQAGVVPGGGVALLRAAQTYLNGLLPSLATDVHKGIALLLAAIREPALQIVRNAGHKDPEAVVKKIESFLESTRGFNASTGHYGDLYELGVVDPAKVVLVALSKAASIGSLLLTTEVLITDIPEPSPGPVNPAMMRMQ
jgi:chaperonin GroEL